MSKKTIRLAFKVEVNDESPLCLAESIAEAEGEDFSIHIKHAIPGQVAIDYKERGKEGWTTYFLTPHALADAVIKHARKETDETDDQSD